MFDLKAVVVLLLGMTTVHFPSLHSILTEQAIEWNMLCVRILY